MKQNIPPTSGLLSRIREALGGKPGEQAQRAGLSQAAQALLATAPGHTLLLGEHGVGKEIFMESLVQRHLAADGGFIYLDGRRDVTKAQQMATAAELAGRGRDWLVVDLDARLTAAAEQHCAELLSERSYQVLKQQMDIALNLNRCLYVRGQMFRRPDMVVALDAFVGTLAKAVTERVDTARLFLVLATGFFAQALGRRTRLFTEARSSNVVLVCASRTTPASSLVADDVFPQFHNRLFFQPGTVEGAHFVHRILQTGTVTPERASACTESELLHLEGFQAILMSGHRYTRFAFMPGQ